MEFCCLPASPDIATVLVVAWLFFFFFFAQIMNCIVWPCRLLCVCLRSRTSHWPGLYLFGNKAPHTQNAQKCIWICIIARIQEIKSSCSYINMCAERKSFVFLQYAARFFSTSFSRPLQRSMKQRKRSTLTYVSRFYASFWSEAITIPNGEKENAHTHTHTKSIGTNRGFSSAMPWKHWARASEMKKIYSKFISDLFLPETKTKIKCNDSLHINF